MLRLDAIYPRDDTYTEWLRYMVQSIQIGGKNERL